MAKNLEPARRRLDKRFSRLNTPRLFDRPLKGWVRAIRDALGMSTPQLAKRLGVTQSRVVKIEKDELTGSLSMDTLSRVADALDCQLVYAIIPKGGQTLEAIVEQQAQKKAAMMMTHIKQTMGLEDQSVETQETDIQIQRLIQQLMAGSPRKLWEED